MKKQNNSMTIRRMMMVLALMVAGAGAWGQNRGDTIFVKEPTYVYANWVGDVVDSAILQIWKMGIQPFWDTCTQSETAMRFYTDTPLQIVGAAGYLSLLEPSLAIIDTDRFHKPVDYFRLYEIDNNGQMDSLNSARIPLDMAPTRWLKSTHRSHPRCTEGEYGERGRPFTQVIPIIESFFDKPSMVQDSFYLGVTNYSLMMRVVQEKLPGGWYMGEVDDTHAWKALYPWLHVGYIQFPIWPCGQDTILQHYKIKNGDCQWYERETIYMMLIWPIFDTTGMNVFNPLDTMDCAQVDQLRMVSQMGDCYLLAWNGSGRHQKWELAYGPEGSTPEECTVMECNATQKILYGMDTSSRTVVYARGYCGRYKWGEWSEGLVIGAPADTVGPDDPVGIEPTLADRFVTLVPNPGSEWMQVLSSFGMRRVVVTDAAGRVVMDEERSGVTTDVDVRSWLRGTYFVQVMTAAGTTTKKFVKL